MVPNHFEPWRPVDPWDYRDPSPTADEGKEGGSQHADMAEHRAPGQHHFDDTPSDAADILARYLQVSWFVSWSMLSCHCLRCMN